jgi:hypothetical protein
LAIKKELLLVLSRILGVFLLTTCVPAFAQPVEAIWHCSRNAAEIVKDDEAGFLGNNMNTPNNTISITLNDLLNVYSGYPLKILGKPLFACFMPGDEALSLDALDTLGLNASALQILSRRSAIVQRQLEVVTSEAQMLLCMQRNAPAFGYLPNPVSNASVAPCF